MAAVRRAAAVRLRVRRGLPSHRPHGEIYEYTSVNTFVLSWLAERKYVVDKSAPLAALDRLKAQVEAYKMEK